jgi:uncharacterized protein
MEDVELYEYEQVNMENGLVITGFPTVGLVGTIATRFVVDQLKLRPTASFTSEHVPPISVVTGDEPYPMVRAYAGEKRCGPDDRCNQLIAVLSELPIASAGLRPLAAKLLSWCMEKHCDTIVCIEGFNTGAPQETVPLVGAGSTQAARKMLATYGVQPIHEGMVSGISGILLCEGRKKEFDVACILAGTHADYPDAKAAAGVLEVVNQMLPEIEIDPDPLYKQAEEIEQQIKAQMQEAQPSSAVYPPQQPTMMYG